MEEQYEYMNMLTGEKFMSPLSPEAINAKADEKDFDLEDWLDHQTLDAKIKDFLYKIKDITLKVGNVIVKIGKFVLNLIFDLAATFKNTIKGAVVGAVIGILLSQIPLIGWILGPIAITTFAFTGAVLGLASDLVNLLTSEKDREILKNAVVKSVAALV